MRRFAALAIALALLNPRPARAGRTRFGWLYDTETVPERGVELETWFLEEDGKGSPPTDESTLWLAPVVGVTDRIELAFPFEISFERSEMESRTDLSRLGAEVRWRLTSPDPVESGPFSALVRLAVKRLVTDRGAVRFEPGLVLAYDIGRVHLVLDLETVVEVPDSGTLRSEFRPGAGVSVQLAGELRAGAEYYSEIALGDTPSTTWHALGPTLSWTHGRFWLAASCPIGLENITAAPRLNWAVGF
jgi:hypothetical protein